MEVTTEATCRNSMTLTLPNCLLAQDLLNDMLCKQRRNPCSCMNALEIM